MRSSSFIILSLCIIALLPLDTEALQEEELTTRLHVGDSIEGQDAPSSENNPTEAISKRTGSEKDDPKTDNVGESTSLGSCTWDDKANQAANWGGSTPIRHKSYSGDLSACKQQCSTDHGTACTGVEHVQGGECRTFKASFTRYDYSGGWTVSFRYCKATFSLLSNDIFKCKRVSKATATVQANFRRRNRADDCPGGESNCDVVGNCRVIYKTGSQNSDKNHDGFNKALSIPNMATPNEANALGDDFDNNWLTKCEDDCNTCAAGIQMGLDLHKCCPGVTFDTSPTQSQLNACRDVDQATVDLSQCGFMTAKCKKFIVWYHPGETPGWAQTQVFAAGSTSLDGYMTAYGTDKGQGSSNHHQPWRYTMWKHSVCKMGGVGNTNSACTVAKRCTCAEAPWQLGSNNVHNCNNVPAEVGKMAAVYCGQF